MQTMQKMPSVSQITDFVHDQVTARAGDLKATIKGAQASVKGAQATAGSAASSLKDTATSTLGDPFEQVMAVAEQVRSGKVVSDTKLLAMLPAALASAASGTGVDDRKMLMEQLLRILSGLPMGSRLAKILSHTLITIVYEDQPHPPTSYMSKKTRFRSLDGSGNNVFMLELGASNTSFARNVTRKHPEPTSLPDTGTVFDLLLCRDKFVPHPSEINMLLFAFHNIMSFDLIRTSHEDMTTNQHSSYLDLQVVYGANEDENRRVRSGANGLLKSDAIADWRMSMVSPASAAIAVLFSRSHNFIAKRLLEVNERNRFDDLDHDSLDEELFGIARLVNCGLYLNIMLRNYLPTILNMPASDFFLNPVETISSIVGVGNLPRGTGNSMSAESLISHVWHAGMSSAEEKWLGDAFRDRFPNRRPEELQPEEFALYMRDEKERWTDMDCGDWELHGWHRNTDGKYPDGMLAKAVKEAINEVAGALEAKGIPVYLRAIYMLGQIQAREAWAVCTMNEYRKFLGLKTFSSFSEWNDDQDIREAAEMLYGHIDNLELYPGLLAEKTKPSVTGSGLCAGYTLSRAILSNIVTLTRSDRFFTTDYSTSNLTSYGFGYANTPQPGSVGMMAKLLMTTLPGQFPYNSTYALFPFNTPSKTMMSLAQQRNAAPYDAGMPASGRRWFTIQSYDACREVLNNKQYFTTLPRTTYNEDIMVSAVHSIPRWKEQFADYYSTHTSNMIGKTTVRFNVPGETRMFDLVEVANVVSAHFTADLFGLPIRETEGVGAMTVNELALALARPLAFDLAGSFTFIGTQTWRLEEKAESATTTLATLLRARMLTLGGLLSPLVTILQGISHAVGGPENINPSHLSRDFYNQLFSLGMKRTEDLTHNCLRMMVSMTGEQTLLMVRVIQWLLREENAEIKQKMHLLALLDDAPSINEFRRYFFEALRLCSLTPMSAHFAVSAVRLPDGKGGSTQLQTGDAVFIPAAAVRRDPNLYNEPTKFDPGNTTAVRFGLGDKPTQVVLDVVLPAMAREILKLKNLRLAPSSQPPTVSDPVPGSDEKVLSFVTETGHEDPLPIQSKMHVLYDGHVI